jgi:hypothetical protein
VTAHHRDASLTALKAPRAVLDGQRWEGGFHAFMRRALSTDHGRALYRKRRHIEPVFGQIKANRRIDPFQPRGRAAVRSEWRLITASHNLLKLHTHWIAPATG